MLCYERAKQSLVGYATNHPGVKKAKPFIKHFYCENRFFVEEVVGVSTRNMVILRSPMVTTQPTNQEKMGI